MTTVSPRQGQVSFVNKDFQSINTFVSLNCNNDEIPDLVTSPIPSPFSNCTSPFSPDLNRLTPFEEYGFESVNSVMRNSKFKEAVNNIAENPDNSEIEGLQETINECKEISEDDRAIIEKALAYHLSVNKCGKCNNIAEFVCGRCFTKRYCCEECQQSDYKNHKSKCLHLSNNKK